MLAIVHHPAYVADTPDGHRFPMRKFAALAARLRADGLVERFEEPQEVAREDLIRAHAPAYVDAVNALTLDRAMVRRIGLPLNDTVVRRARLATGGTLLAARLALRDGAAANTAGGSHHARPDGGAGFCVFNDVAVAALALLAEAAAARILVVDLDVHHGDGTALIFRNDPRVVTFSMHCDANWPLDKPAGDRDVALPPGLGDEGYLAALAAHLPGLIEDTRPDLVFYNAGVDPHAEDKLGKLALTDAGLARRDAFVAQAALGRGVPVAGVIGGGYGDDVEALARRHALLHHALAQALRRRA